MSNPVKISGDCEFRNVCVGNWFYVYVKFELCSFSANFKLFDCTRCVSRAYLFFITTDLIRKILHLAR